MSGPIESTLWRGGALLLGLICYSSCRCAGDKQAAPASPPKKLEASACVRGSAQLTLSPQQAPAATEEPEAVDLPFSVELGDASVEGGEFLVTASRFEGKGEAALLARLGPGGAGEIIELGPLAGDSAPPRLSAAGGEVVVAVLEGDASGRNLRLGRLSQNAAPARVAWGPELHQGRDESTAFDVELSGGAVVVAWDDWNAAGKHGVVQSASWSLADFGGAAAVTLLSVAGRDAETPRLAARPAGFWVAWVVNGKRAGSVAQKAAGARGTADAPPESDEGAPVLVSGERWIELALLDEHGKPAGEARRITTSTRPVSGFDLTTGPEGQAWLVWQEGAQAAPQEGGRIVMAVVDVGGASNEYVLQDTEVGAGTPGWLAVARGAGPERWLSFMDTRDRARLLYVQQPGSAVRAATLGSAWRDAAALAAIGGDVLFAMPRGRALELSLARCRPDNFDAGVP